MLFFTIVVFVLILGILIFVHELGHFIYAKRAGIKVMEFGFGFPPRIYGKKYKGTTYSINAVPIGGFVKIYGEDGEGKNKADSFASKSVWTRFKIIVAGVFFNVLFAVLILSIYFWSGGPTFATDPTNYTDKSNTISEAVVWSAEADSPAEAAGLQKGDIIEEINGEKIGDFAEVQQIVKTNPDQKVVIKLSREGEEIDTEVILGNKDGQGYLGVRGVDNYIYAKYPWWKVPYIAAVEIVKIIWVIISILYIYLRDLIVKYQKPEDIAGPVGIFVLTKQVIGLGFNEVLRFVALLSVNLAIINILPLPALDGGRVVFLLIEKIRGKSVTPRIESIVHSIGFAVLIALIILITYQDVLKFIIRK